MNERLSPKKAPPTTMAVMSAVLTPKDCASPAAIGTRATIVPTLVPMDRLMKQVARKRPGNNMLLGRTDNIRFTVASTEPMVFAVLAKAPAKTNIHIISIMFSLLAPLLKTFILALRFLALQMQTAYMQDTMNATLMGMA